MRKSVILMLGLSVLLGGCVNLGNKAAAPAQLFTLSAPTLGGAGVTAGVGEALVVAEPETDRALVQTRIAVQVDAHSLAYLPEGLWAERPARLFRNLIAETIRAGGNRLVVLDDADALQGGPRLGGRLVAFGYDARSHAAVVRYDALRRGADGRLSQQRFEASVPVAKPRAQDVAKALDQAAGKMAVQVADWMK